MSPTATSTTASPNPLKIAILLNSYRSPFITEIRDSYIRSLAAVAPDCSLTFFYPADKPGHQFPDPSAFDLIVIGGGNADPRKRHAWILAVHAFILDVVAHQQQGLAVAKLCGICWGHQTISMLFGGEVGDMEVPEVCLPALPWRVRAAGLLMGSVVGRDRVETHPTGSTIFAPLSHSPSSPSRTRLGHDPPPATPPPRGAGPAKGVPRADCGASGVFEPQQCDSYVPRAP